MGFSPNVIIGHVSNTVFCLSKTLISSHSEYSELITTSLFAPRKFFRLFSSANFFPKSTFLKNSFGNTIRVSNRLDPNQVRHFVGPDLGLICLQRLSADNTSR